MDRFERGGKGVGGRPGGLEEVEAYLACLRVATGACIY